jgi:hypothetical protein
MNKFCALFVLALSTFIALPAVRVGAADPGDYENGVALVKTGKYAEAEAALRRAVAAKPNDTAALQALAGTLQKQGKDKEAAEVYEHLADVLTGAAPAPAKAPVAPPGNVGAPAPDAAPAKIGPLAVGDAVEIPFGGKWHPGTVTYAQGLTYFVHWGEVADNGKWDRFFHLYELRPVGSDKTLAETYKETTPDPAHGPIAIGATVIPDIERSTPCRVARRLGGRYVIFPEDPVVRTRAAEAWVYPSTLRPVGSKDAFAPTAADVKPPQPTRLADVKIGDVIESYKRGGYGWFQCTVMAIDHGRYYVQAGPDSAIRAWVTPVHMRPVGGKERFEPENLEQFTGDWRLTGDAFFTTAKSVNKGDHIEKTMVLNSGAGQDAGHVKINADGTYVVTHTAVYRDDVPGNWIRNPDQGEGGILLQGGDSPGKDLVVTPYPNGGIYLQGALRGPGKIGTRQ